MNSALKVGLDVSAVPVQPAGAGRYIVELAAGLSVCNDIELVAYSRRSDADRWRQGATTVVAALPQTRPARLLYERLALGPLVAKSALDLYHGPHYTMPGRIDTPVAVTVHDCTFFDHPEWHERSKVALFRRAITRAASKADLIICVSATTEADLRRHCDVRGEVVVIPHGVDHSRFSPCVGEDDRSALAAMGLPDGAPYVAFVGTQEPRKGITTLIEAFDVLAASRPDLHLVLAGHSGWGNVTEGVTRATHRQRIVLPGYCSDGAVVALLRNASVVAYPSLAEGFGLPALEALACGAPLVTTEGTAMAEFTTGIATMAEPGSVESLVGALTEVLDRDEATRADAARRGIAAAGAFTWQRTVDAHIESYRRVTRT